MTNIPVAPIFGLVTICFIGIIGGVFLVSWLKEVIQKECNKNGKNSVCGRSAQKQNSDIYNNLYGTQTIYQCQSCASKTSDQTDVPIVHTETPTGQPERHLPLSNTLRCGKSMCNNTLVVNQNNTAANSNPSDIYLRYSGDTLLNNGPKKLMEKANMVQYNNDPLTKRVDKSNYGIADKYSRYETVLQMNAARGANPWTTLGPKVLDNGNGSTKTAAIKSSFSLTNLASSYPYYKNEFPQKKGKSFPIGKQGHPLYHSNSVNAQSSLSNKNKVSLIYSQKPDGSGTNPAAAQFPTSPILIEEVIYEERGNMHPMSKSFYQKLSPTLKSVKSDVSSNYMKAGPIVRLMSKSMGDESTNDLDVINEAILDDLPLPPYPSSDNASAGNDDADRKSPIANTQSDEPKLPTYEESLKYSQPVNESSYTMPSFLPPRSSTQYC